MTIKVPRPLDILAFLLCVAAVAVAIPWSSATSSGTPVVVIESSDDFWEFPLDYRTDLTIIGPVGETQVVLDDNGVHVHDSDCRDQICVAMGTISEPGTWIACLPNRVFIRIETTEIDGSEEDAIDAGTY